MVTVYNAFLMVPVLLLLLTLAFTMRINKKIRENDVQIHKNIKEVQRLLRERR